MGCRSGDDRHESTGQICLNAFLSRPLFKRRCKGAAYPSQAPGALAARLSDATVQV